MWNLKRNKKQSQTYIEFLPIISQLQIDINKENKLTEYYINTTTTTNTNSDKTLCIEITLVFNDENLAINTFIDKLYRILRRLYYGRTVDIETFYTYYTEKKETLNLKQIEFKNIGSAGATYKQTAHYNITTQGIAFHNIDNHPIVYCNTWNHAFGNTDNNKEYKKTFFKPTTQKWLRKKLAQTNKNEKHTYIKIKYGARKTVEKKLGRSFQKQKSGEIPSSKTI